MMHSMGLHSALAIKRQRKRREDMKKARERRFSSQSTESGLSSCNSLRGSNDRPRSCRKRKVAVPQLSETKVVSSIGMLHIGIVFLVLGIFLIGSGIIPDDYTSWDSTLNWKNELVYSGIASIVIGIFLIVLNHYLSKKEDDELSKYVESQLTRSRSGKRLIKDEETGCLSTKQEKKVKENTVVETEVHHLHHPYPALKSPPRVSESTPKSDLDFILEEEQEALDEKGDSELYRMEYFNKDTLVNGGCSSEFIDRELVVTRYYNTSR